MHRTVVVRIVSVILVAAAGLAGSSCRYGRAATAPAFQPHADPIASGTFIVEPRNYKMFKVVVAAGMAKPRIEGTFSATGARNDIEVTLLDDANYANWQSRRRFEATYDSGRVTDGTIGVDLPAEPGTWWVVFSNRFSLFSNKAVVADVKLRYDGLVETTGSRRGRSRR